MRVKVFVSYVGLFSILFWAFFSGRALAQESPSSRYASVRKNPSSRIPSPAGVDADSHFRRILANTQVRVYRVTLGANEATLLDAHPHDYIVVSLGTNEIEAAGEGNNHFPLEMNDGEAQVLTGGWPHKLVNRASQTANLLVLEVARGISPHESVCGLSGRSCNQARFGKTVEGRYSQSLLFETSSVRLFRAELGPGDALPSHTDAADHLLVTLTDARLIDGFDEVPKPAGDATWAPGGLSNLKNSGPQEARILILEIK